MSILKSVFVATVMLASQSQANPISSDCLVKSDNTAGQATGLVFSHEEALTTNEKISDELRVQTVKSCVDEDGELTGLQLILGVPDFTKVVKMEAIGNTQTTCTTTTFKVPINRTKAGSDERGSGVNNLRIIAGSTSEGNS